MRTMTLCLLLCAGLATGGLARDGADIEKRVYETRRIESGAPVMDGRLDDSAWDLVQWSGDFIQRQPNEGEPPTAQTRFKVLYDDEALYFGFHAHDDPALVTSMLARRDWFPGDWVEVNIGSYGDNRTAFSFTLSVSGTRGDEFISDDGRNWDGSWDPVWQGATDVNGDGWTAEMKIPLSQLRFSGAEEQTWGLQVQRRIFREEERSSWQEIPQDMTGWVSNFGELRGIRGLEPSRRVEIMPYTVAKAESFEKTEGDPFADGSDADLGLGVDGKIGLSSDLTLDFTINPDFGQVEADPSEVNLTAFETFFSEQRPFFIEGSDILRMQMAPAITGGHFTRDNLFYSRRIGKRPAHYPDLGDDEFVDQPDNTSILGAFKLSGKTASGLSIGILESVTAREEAEIDLNGVRRKETVEPATNYFVGRVIQDYREGDTQLGAMVTTVNRNIEDDHLEFLRRRAYAGGVDFRHLFHDRDYQLEARFFASHLSGSPEAILDAQTSSARYYQRPDNTHSEVDSARTDLNGQAGSIMLRRMGNNTPWRFQTGMAWRSPGFEINDLGYMRRADEINQFTWGSYAMRNPKGAFNNWFLNVNQWMNWDSAGKPLSKAVNINTNAEFRNRWWMYMGVSRSFDYISNTELRGGPSSRWPGDTEYSWNMHTDSRRKLRFGMGGYGVLGDEDSVDLHNGWISLVYRPSNAIRLSLHPSYMRRIQEMQYIDTGAFAGDDRYLFGSIDQKTASVTFRVDYCLTPNLTLQYYAMPFVSSASYREFKRITNPRASRYRDRFHTFSGDEISFDADNAEYAIDEDRDGTTDYTIGMPDFNFRDFNSNLVMRWEFQPGSTMFLVWSQSRTDYVESGDFDFGSDLGDLFGREPHDVFLIKINKWFSM